MGRDQAEEERNARNPAGLSDQAGLHGPLPRRGRTAGEALRGFIEGAVEARRARRTHRKLIAGALVAAAVGAIALPSLAQPMLRAGFDRLVTAADFARLDTDHDGKISFGRVQRGPSVAENETTTENTERTRKGPARAARP